MGESSREKVRKMDAPLLALKMEEEAGIQERQAALGSWERQGKEFSSKACRAHGDIYQHISTGDVSRAFRALPST